MKVTSADANKKKSIADKKKSIADKKKINC